VRWDGKQWLADVVDLPGAHTYARTVDSLRKRLREVAVLMADLPDSALEDSEAFHVSLDYTAVVKKTVGQASRPAAPGYDELARIMDERDALRAKVDELSLQLAERTTQAIERAPPEPQPAGHRLHAAPVPSAG
jgi:predicted RNase H-like HicB family nuclease